MSTWTCRNCNNMNRIDEPRCVKCAPKAEGQSPSLPPGSPSGVVEAREFIEHVAKTFKGRNLGTKATKVLAALQNQQEKK